MVFIVFRVYIAVMIEIFPISLLVILAVIRLIKRKRRKGVLL